MSTPVTFSLKVTLYTSVWLSVFSAAGLYLSIDASVGAVASAGTVLTVYVWSVPEVGTMLVSGFFAISSMPWPGETRSRLYVPSCVVTLMNLRCR